MCIRDSPSTGKNSIPYYPSNGASIDYYLPADVEALRLEILNNNGKVIRRFTSATDKPKDASKAEPSMATGFAPKGATPLLKKTKGMHRFKWDLRHEGAWDKDAKKNGRNGILVAPNTYSIRLTVGEQSYTQSLEIKEDPRLIESNVTKEDLAAQEALGIKIRDLQSRAKKLAYTLAQQKKKLDGQKTTANEKEIQTINALTSKLVTTKGRYHQPMLLGQLNYLAYMSVSYTHLTLPTTPYV